MFAQNNFMWRCISESGAADARTLPARLQPGDGSCGSFTVVTVRGPGDFSRSKLFHSPAANTRQQNMLLFRDCALLLLSNCLNQNSVTSKLWLCERLCSRYNGACGYSWLIPPSSRIIIMCLLFFNQSILFYYTYRSFTILNSTWWRVSFNTGTWDLL